MPGGAAVDRGAPAPAGLGDVTVLRQVRRRSERPQADREVPDVVTFVAADRDPAPALQGPDHREPGVPFAATTGSAGGGADHETVAVLGQQVAEIREPALPAITFADQPGIAVGARGVGGVLALLAAEVGVVVAPAARRIVAPPVAWPEALHRRPGLDQRAVDAEVLVREQPADLGPVQHLNHEARRQIAIEQSVPVLRKPSRPCSLIATEAGRSELGRPTLPDRKPPGAFPITSSLIVTESGTARPSSGTMSPIAAGDVAAQRRVALLF
jgi:hypothetical protein